MNLPEYTKLQVMEVISASPMVASEIWRYWQAHFASPASVAQADLDALLRQLVAGPFAEQDTSGRIALTPAGVEELHRLRGTRKAGESEHPA